MNDTDQYVNRLVGGALMFAVGVFYLLFQKRILVQSDSTVGSIASPLPDGLSRGIIGAQVCR